MFLYLSDPYQCLLVSATNWFSKLILLIFKAYLSWKMIFSHIPQMIINASCREAICLCLTKLPSHSVLASFGWKQFSFHREFFWSSFVFEFSKNNVFSAEKINVVLLFYFYKAWFIGIDLITQFLFMWFYQWNSSLLQKTIGSFSAHPLFKLHLTAGSFWLDDLFSPSSSRKWHRTNWKSQIWRKDIKNLWLENEEQ